MQSQAGNSLDQTLVDAHLVLVPGLGTLTVGGLTGGDVQGLGGKTDGALDLEGLGAGTVDELLAHLLERGDLARGEGDTDLVDLLSGVLALLEQLILKTRFFATATASPCTQCDNGAMLVRLQQRSV